MKHRIQNSEHDTWNHGIQNMESSKQNPATSRPTQNPAHRTTKQN